MKDCYGPIKTIKDLVVLDNQQQGSLGITVSGEIYKWDRETSQAVRISFDQACQEIDTDRDTMALIVKSGGTHRALCCAAKVEKTIVDAKMALHEEPNIETEPKKVERSLERDFVSHEENEVHEQNDKPEEQLDYKALLNAYTKVSKELDDLKEIVNNQQKEIDKAHSKVKGVHERIDKQISPKIEKLEKHTLY